MYGTSKRRYGQVKLVQVPEEGREAGLKANKEKSRLNPLLANFEAMSHTGPLYAALGCTHFVEAQKVILEGGMMMMMMMMMILS